MSVTALRRTQEHPQPAIPQIFDILRGRIISLALPPGTPLSRTALQQQFRTSSTPIRDALMRLQEQGLVDVFPQSGTVVSLIDMSVARQAQFLRRSIEQEAVRALAAEAETGLVRNLRSIIAEQRSSAKDDDFERFNDADQAFHKMLFDAAGAPDLWVLVRQRSGHIDRIRRLHLPVSGKAAQIVRDHSAIVKAIADGDPVRAQSELRDHLSRSLAFSDELRARFPTYFRIV